MSPTSLFRRHVTLTGRVLTFRTPSPPMAAFLARLEAAVTDPTISEDDFVAIFHGPDNPLLRHDIVTGRSVVTADPPKDARLLPKAPDAFRMLMTFHAVNIGLNPGAMGSGEPEAAALAAYRRARGL